LVTLQIAAGFRLATMSSAATILASRWRGILCGV
jgi:hypothetical protein